MEFCPLWHQVNILTAWFLVIQSRLRFGPFSRGGYVPAVPYEKVCPRSLAARPSDDRWRLVGIVFCPF